jgi:hypothetical protein
MGQCLTRQRLMGQCLTRQRLMGQCLMRQRLMGQCLMRQRLMGQCLTRQCLTGQRLMGQCLTRQRLMGQGTFRRFDNYPYHPKHILIPSHFYYKQSVLLDWIAGSRETICIISDSTMVTNDRTWSHVCTWTNDGAEDWSLLGFDAASLCAVPDVLKGCTAFIFRMKVTWTVAWRHWNASKAASHPRSCCVAGNLRQLLDTDEQDPPAQWQSIHQQWASSPGACQILLLYSRDCSEFCDAVQPLSRPHRADYCEDLPPFCMWRSAYI